ncbi:MAG: nucleotide sugar dehydrogenase [Candidatus Paceibacterota bacterium]
MNRSVAIVGQGYVGLPLAVEAAKAGWRVIGYEKSERLVASLNNGVSHVEDIGNDILMDLLKNGSYYATSSPKDIAECEYVVLCVPTPLNSEREPDLSILKNAVLEISGIIKEDVTLISESTSYPGTVNSFIKDILKSTRQDRGNRVLLCSAPERVDPINKVYKMRNTPRLLSGESDAATQSAYKFYSSFCDNVIIVSSPLVAEFAKLLENTFRQVNIALINQLTPYIRSMGVDVREVVDAAGSKPYGFMKFYPGAGPGGHCIPIDPLYLSWSADKAGYDLSIIKEADRVNNSMAEYVVNRVIGFGGVKKVLLVGVAYKSNIGDIRESSSLRVGEIFNNLGVEVLWYDPLVERYPVGKAFHNNDQIDAAVLLVRHDEMDLTFLVNKNVPVLDCTGTISEGNVYPL